VRHVEIGFDVADGARELFVRGDVAFGVFTLLQDALGFFLVLPKGGIARLCFEGFQSVAVSGNVKDSSARGRCVFSILQSESEDLRCDHSQFPSLNELVNQILNCKQKKLILRWMLFASAQNDTSEVFSS